MTYELNRLLCHLRMAFVFIENKKPASARMQLTQAIMVLRLFKNDFSDAKDMYIKANCTLSSVTHGWRGVNTRTRALVSLNDMIYEAESWYKMRMCA